MQTYSLETRPFDDGKMTFDTTEKMYILKDDYVNNRLNIVLADLFGSEAEANVFLYEISEKLYNYIFMSANPQFRSRNIAVKKYKLENDHKLRDYLAKALLSYARASIRSDIDRLSDEARVDAQSGVRKDIKADDHIPQSVKEILTQSGIMYTGVYLYEIE